MRWRVKFLVINLGFKSKEAEIKVVSLGEGLFDFCWELEIGVFGFTFYGFLKFIMY